MTKKNNLNGILLYAKTPGLTSFSSLWSIKHALLTDKVGHTGTLDSFADGLLVVLSGSLTHLVPHITGFTKTYRAVICFGKATDTLDPTGEFVSKGKAVTKDELETVLPEFTGTLLQEPPVYSALHVDGKRASNLVREGSEVHLESRQVFVYEINLLDFKEPSDSDECSYALIEVVCSKGTYIRALARDIAKRLETVSYLCALRRTQVGPFFLEDAACSFLLKDFTIENGIENSVFFQNQRQKFLANTKTQKKEKKTDSIEIVSSIKSHFMSFSPELASLCGFEIDLLKNEFESKYINGRNLFGKMFVRLPRPQEDIDSKFNAPGNIAVFYEDKSFAGMIKISPEKRLSYSFVVPHEKSFTQTKIYSWQQILDGEFNYLWKKTGTCISVGSFDGVHAGHQKLLENISKSNFIKGCVTFRNSTKAMEKNFSGSIDSLEQRINFLRQYQLDFLIIIDFSDDFSKIDGKDFISILVEKCGLKCLVEGTDFKCGNKGLYDIEKLKGLAEDYSFSLEVVDDVLVDGKKVSSSSIRDLLGRSDFGTVQKYLLRPYEYDLQNLKWKEEKALKNDSLFSSKVVSNQILPPDGNYDVIVKMSETEENVIFQGSQLNILHTLCTIENDGKTILLILPSLNYAQRARTLSFLPVAK